MVDRIAEIMKFYIARYKFKLSLPSANFHFAASIFQFICDICKMCLSTQWNLRRHMKKHRPKMTWFQCQRCMKSFSTKYNYDQHYQRWHEHGKLRKPKEISETSKKLKPKISNVNREIIIY